jgi:Acetyltransferase (GNAT) domain
VLLLPLFRLDGRLLLWGAGTSDWLDGLCEPGLDAADLAPALAALGEPLDLFQLPPNSALLCAPLPPGWRDRRGEAECCPALDLPARIPARMRQNIRYYRRRAEAAGIKAPERAGAEAIEVLAALHTRRWSRRDEPGIFADPRLLAWQRAALAGLDGRGLLRLHVLRREGRIVAALVVLAAKRRAFYFIGGFDPDLAPLGLGTVLVGHAIAQAEREGCVSFDFLRGREPYKYRWGATDRPALARAFLPHREAAA